MAVPGLDLLLTGGQGGLSLSTPATSATGANFIGGFNFQPKGGSLPPMAWYAIAGAAALVAIVMLRKR